jgi:hypothetical protein
MVAAARPRDEKVAIDRIANACQRPRLAEVSQYEYSKGGTAISGPSIRLLETVAGAWQNMQYGFRELENRGGESQVECFAWDLETNTKAVRTFSVPHQIKAHGGTKRLSDPREIYELVANQAQRRVRACLEEVIPRDVVEEALEACQKTMREKEPVTTQTIAKLVKAFEGLGVTKDQLEARIQRRMDTMSPGQLAQMRRIYTSIKDGVSTPEEWFKSTKPEPATVDVAAAKSKAAADLAALNNPEPKPSDADPLAIADGPPSGLDVDWVTSQLAAAKTAQDARNVFIGAEHDCANDDEKAWLDKACKRKIEQLTKAEK